MDFSSLEVFCAVATEQSVMRASVRLARAQANVTSRIRQLETELDVQLFSRAGKHMTLTQNGEQLFDYASRILTLAAEARDALSPAGAASLAGRLRIGSMESSAATRLPALLSGYHGKWPEVALEITIGTSASLVDEVARHKLDCAFVAITDAGAHSSAALALAARGLQATPVCTEELVLVLPPNHPPVSTPADLKVATLAVFPAGCTYRCVLEHWLHGVPMQQAWHVSEQASYHSILTCVAAGSCFTLCPRSILNLQRVPMDVRTQTITSIDTYLVSRTAHPSAALEALLGALRAGRPPEPRTLGMAAA
jgi:DNA-binding transcriptional LysR family regulator